MKPRILFVNPPIYDFTAYDFWIKPYGLLRAAGRLRSAGKLFLFDYLDRHHPSLMERGLPARALGAGKACPELVEGMPAFHWDPWGRGAYPNQRIEKPACFKGIPRYYRRFGIDRTIFQKYLLEQGLFDIVLIQTMMTYWYPGVKEVIEDIRRFCPQAKIVLGGFYATACTDHAKALGADVVIKGDDFQPLQSLGLEVSDEFQLPVWQLYPKLNVGVLTLTQGCPFQCSYCFVPKSGVGFSPRPLAVCLVELEQLISLGVENIAFYDDALLFQPDKTLIPFLQAVIEKQMKVNFHTPNALHARFITPQLAKLMVAAGFKTFYLGFESYSPDFHAQTGSGKVVSDELAAAVENLLSAGADRKNITAYEMLGHPKSDVQQLEQSMRFANGLGIQIMLSDFSPIPGTPDGDLCRKYADLDEPLNHNKTAFPIWLLGFDKVNYYKDLCRQLNRQPGNATVSVARKVNAGETPALPNKGWSYRGYLPHFDSGEISQFITFRLYDSVPEEVITRWKVELNWREDAAADSPEAVELRKRIETYADAGHGQCFLKDKRIAKLVEDALLYFDRQRYELYEWRIMPNHVHVLCRIYPAWNLDKIVHSWKSFTSHKANALLNRTGQFWMLDYFDRYIRDQYHFLKTVEYIRNNGR